MNNYSKLIFLLSHTIFVVHVGFTLLSSLTDDTSIKKKTKNNINTSLKDQQWIVSSHERHYLVNVIHFYGQLTHILVKNKIYMAKCFKSKKSLSLIRKFSCISYGFRLPPVEKNHSVYISYAHYAVKTVKETRMSTN